MSGDLVLWILILLGIRQITSGYIETVIASGCESCQLLLTCRHLSSIIAILEANFTTLDSNETFVNNSITPTSFPPFHPRQALNQRCSGVNHCSFILTEDCPGAVSWGPGTLSVKYVCISEDRIRTFCNSEIVLSDNSNTGISEGFIHNPGYPRFYSSEKECRWKIRAPYQQKILVKVLDIAVIADNTILPYDCTDHLEIIDSGQIVHSTCRQEEPPLQIMSGTDTVELVLASSHSLMPLRGVFLHFTAVGCPTPPAPEDGYLVYRNDTAVEFRCCVGFVFPDDGEKSKIITCLGAFWDVALPLPNCQKKSFTPFIQQSRKPHLEEMSSEIVAPALLIVALFLINFIVLFYIYKMKQKNALDYADEELGTLKNVVSEQQEENMSP